MTEGAISTHYKARLSHTEGIQIPGLKVTQIDKHAVEIFRAGMTYRQNAVMYVRI